MIAGLISRSACAPSPSLSSVPGLKFASTTSDCATRRLTTSTPSARAQVRRRCSCSRDARSRSGPAKTRAPSGNARLSILITSAPWSREQARDFRAEHDHAEVEHPSPLSGWCPRCGPGKPWRRCGARAWRRPRRCARPPAARGARPARAGRRSRPSRWERRGQPARQLGSDDRLASAVVSPRPAHRRVSSRARSAPRAPVLSVSSACRAGGSDLERLVQPVRRERPPADRVELRVLEFLGLPEPGAMACHWRGARRTTRT